MRSPKFYKIIIIALVLLNLTTHAFYWLSKPSHPPRPERPKISSELNLTGDAKSKVDALEKKHHILKKKLVARDHDLHTKLFKSIGENKENENLFLEIAENKEEIEEMTFEFFDEIAQYCNAKQKKHLRNFVQKRLNNLRPGPRPPRK